MTDRVDTITGSSGASLGAASDGLGSWTAQTGLWQYHNPSGASAVNSNTATNGNAYLESDVTDVEVVTSKEVSSGAGGPMARSDGTLNFYYGNVRSDNTPRIFKVVAGTASQISAESTGNTSAGTHTLKLKATGTDPVLLELYVDDVLKATASDSTNKFVGTKHGIYATGNNYQFYDISITEIAGTASGVPKSTKFLMTGIG
jgi:hypothetical protein